MQLTSKLESRQLSLDLDSGRDKSRACMRPRFLDVPKVTIDSPMRAYTTIEATELSAKGKRSVSTSNDDLRNLI